jgi:hypothetical protein
MTGQFQVKRPAKPLGGLIVLVALLVVLIGIQLLNLLNFRTDGGIVPFLFLGRTIVLFWAAVAAVLAILRRSSLAIVWVSIASPTWVGWFIYIDYLNYKMNGYVSPVLWLIYGAMAVACVLALVYVRHRITDGTLN